MKKQDFKVLKTKDLYPFPDNPFHVAEDTEVLLYGRNKSEKYDL